MPNINSQSMLSELRVPIFSLQCTTSKQDCLGEAVMYLVICPPYLSVHYTQLQRCCGGRKRVGRSYGGQPEERDS